MNISRLALRANPGGALHPRLSSRIKHIRTLPADRRHGRLPALLLQMTCAVTGLAAVSPAATVPALNLTWNANTESNITGYKLKYGTTSGVYPNEVSVGTTPAAAVPGLSEGTTYYFVVSAINGAGLESPVSAEVSHLTDVITDLPANNAPVALAGSVTTSEDKATTVTLAGTDPDGDTLSYSIVSRPANGTLSGTPPNLSYTPNADFHGSDSFTFSVNDGTVNSANATVSITVSPVNDAPVAIARSLTTPEDNPLAFVLTGSDKDGNSLTYTVVSNPANGVLTGTAPNLTYTPAANFHGSDSFTFHVNDGTVNSATATVSISVTAVNDAPVAAPKSATTVEDTPVAVTLTATDVEGSTLTYSVVSQPTKGTLTGTPPNVTYQPNAGYTGNDSFTYRAYDGAAYSPAVTVSVTVAKKAPFAGTSVIPQTGWTLKSVTTQETFDAPATQAFDGNPATFWHSQWRNGANLPHPHEIQINLGSSRSINGFQYLPRQDQPIVGNIGDYEFYVSTDGVNWGSPVATGTFTSSKAEKQVLFSPLTGQFIRLRALSEVSGYDDTCVAEISVLQGSVTNQPPVATAQSVTTGADTPLPLVLDGSDPEGNPLTWSVVASPQHGTLSGTPPNLSYLPHAGFSGTDQFTFRANDGAVFSPAATVAITVTPPVVVPGNTPPVFPGPLAALATEDEPFTGKLNASDADAGDVLTFSKISGPAWLTVSPDGTLGGTPANQNVGSNVFNVKVSDTANASATTMLIIQVANKNNAPVFKVTPLVYAAGTEKVLYRDQTLAYVAADPDAGDSFSFSKVSGPEWLTVSKNGSLGGTPPSGSAGLNEFTVRVTDAAGAFTNSVLLIRINSNTLPLPWNLDRVGKGNLAGPAKYSAGTFTVAGAGALAEKEDAGNFGWQTLTGDGQIVARISKLQDTGSATRVGVMIRGSLAANSRQVFFGLNGAGNLHWQRRAVTGGKAVKTTYRAPKAAKNGKSARVWVKLVRKGDTLTSYRSTNGVKWTKVGSSRVKLPKNCYIGLSVSSGKKDKLNTSKFSNVKVVR